MKPFILLRMLAWVKRGAIALESIAASQKAMAETVVAPTRKGKIKLSEVYTPSIEEMNTEWQRRQDEEMYGEELPR